MSSGSIEELNQSFPSPVQTLQKLPTSPTRAFSQSSFYTSRCTSNSEVTLANPDLVGFESTVRLVDPYGNPSALFQPPSRSFSGSTLDSASSNDSDLTLEVPQRSDGNPDQIPSPILSDISYLNSKNPQLSWALTMLLLVAVTVVRRTQTALSCMSLIP